MCAECWPPRLRRSLLQRLRGEAVRLHLVVGRPGIDRTAHGCEWSLHCAYLGFVAMHWDYAMVAAGLMVVMIVNRFLFPD